MKAKLTAALIKTLKPGPKRYAVRDTEIPGFILRITPAGVMTYYLDYRSHDGKRKDYRIGRADRMTITLARQEAKAARGKVDNGDDPQGVRVERRRATERAKASTLAAFVGGRFHDWASAELKTGSAIMPRVVSRFPDLLNKPMDNITVWDVTRWRSQRLKAGVKAGTLNRDVADLKRVLSKAAEWGIIESTPLAGMKDLKGDTTGRVRFLSADEEQRLRDALQAREERKREKRNSGNLWRLERHLPTRGEIDGRYADHIAPMVLLAMNTGLRRGEIFNLQWSDVDLDRATLTVQGAGAKSKQTRYIPLNRETVDVMTAWEVQRNSELVFPSPATGGRLDNIKTAWEALRKAADLEDFNFHDLRHHFASRLVMASIDLNTVRELLGHADLKMTLRYSHLAPEHKAAAVAALDRPRGNVINIQQAMEA
jgi:integrase